MRLTAATGWHCCMRAAWWLRARPRTSARVSAEGGGGLRATKTEAGADPAELARRIETRFGLKPSVVDGVLRVEIANGHRFITEVVEAFPGAIDSVGLHKPTLGDVFVP